MVTSIFQRRLGVIMVAPMLAGSETTSGRSGRTQSGCGSQEGRKMHFESGVCRRFEIVIMKM